MFGIFNMGRRIILASDNIGNGYFVIGFVIIFLNCAVLIRRSEHTD